MFATVAPTPEAPLLVRARARASDAEPDTDTGADGPLAQRFARHGGVVPAEEVALLMRRHVEQPVSQLARWIVGGRVVHFTERSQTLVPLFQFFLDDMSIRPAVATLLGELGSVMDSDELATWLVTPNDWLAGASPIETLEVDFPAVLDAARADRFVAAG